MHNRQAHVPKPRTQPQTQDAGPSVLFFGFAVRLTVGNVVGINPPGQATGCNTDRRPKCDRPTDFCDSDRSRTGRLALCKHPHTHTCTRFSSLTFLFCSFFPACSIQHLEIMPSLQPARCGPSPSFMGFSATIKRPLAGGCVDAVWFTSRQSNGLMKFHIVKRRAASCLAERTKRTKRTNRCSAHTGSDRLKCIKFNAACCSPFWSSRIAGWRIVCRHRGTSWEPLEIERERERAS